MPSLVLTTPEGLELEREIAGAGSRFCAALFDALLVTLALLAALFVALLATATDPTGLSGFLVGVLLGGLLLVLIAYQVAFAVLWDGQTPGKRLLGLRVASADGWPASAGQHLLRSLVWPLDVLLPLPMPFGLLGLVIILLSRRGQRLGDLVAGTLVLRESLPRATREPFPGERWSRLETRRLALAPGLAARLSDDDFDFLRELLARERLDPTERRRLYVDGARHFAERLELGPFDDAREFLRELYLYLREARESRPGSGELSRPA